MASGAPAAPVLVERRDRLVTITLDDPARRNALSASMFEALERALDDAAIADGAGPAERGGATPAASPHGALILRLRGAGEAFCAGFDLQACAGDGGQRMLASFLERLSRVVRRIRRGPWVAVAEVRGAALAGGCAIAAACDFVMVAEGAKLGYPVHRIGVSPAVNAPLVASAMGHGAARSLLLSGELIDGREAQRRGLATRAVPDEALASTVDALCERLLAKGPVALLETRRWLDRLDGSADDRHFEASLRASLDLCGGEESVRLLRDFWASRRT